MLAGPKREGPLFATTAMMPATDLVGGMPWVDPNFEELFEGVRPGVIQVSGISKIGFLCYIYIYY